MKPRVFDPKGVGWRIGQAREPRGGQLWVPVSYTHLTLPTNREV